MNARLLSLCLCATAAAVFPTGCLMRQTVTDGGQVTSDHYVIKRPLKDLVERSSTE